MRPRHLVIHGVTSRHIRLPRNCAVHITPPDDSILSYPNKNRGVHENLMLDSADGASGPLETGMCRERLPARRPRNPIGDFRAE